MKTKITQRERYGNVPIPSPVAAVSMPDHTTAAAALHRQRQLADSSVQLFALGQRMASMQVRPQATDAAQLVTIPVAQLQKIGGYEVTVDRAGYASWDMDDGNWHLTPKDLGRWHVTKQDRSVSYWFSVDGGSVTPVEPTKKEAGNDKKRTKKAKKKDASVELKHQSLDNAPKDLKKLIMNHISDIIKVE